MSDWNRQVIEEFRANGGRVGGRFEGADLLLLTSTGRKSGARHTTPLGSMADGDRLLVFASNAGGPNHPAWYHNIRADPRVTVEAGT
ncbi:nitroreductase family deazaflavin-dependent oxidoreductase, partial [Micromonospora aurantiaca]|nr:nitroreductase family deazaflavin-dependent oxidoreductase [Micromonospora aurantiaca]